MKKLKIGFVGVGCISGIYLKNIQNTFDNIEIAGICDLEPEKCTAAAEKFNIPKIYGDMYELFADPEVDIVLNITRPYEHYEVTKAALLAGKHVYSEKPLSPDLNEARELYALAKEKGLYLGGAPDTFLGAGIQTVKKLIEDGYIGRVIGGRAHMASRGPENWHPDPEFVYQYGGGPMFDMGPYYVTAFINLMGRVTEVCGMTSRSFERRPITSEKKYGKIMDVEVPTYVEGIMRFESGAIAQLFTTFDICTKSGILFEIYGTEGSIRVPDPNTFGEPGVQLLRLGAEKYENIPLVRNYSGNSRALGLAEMAECIVDGTLNRANSAQQLHVVEIMSAFYRSSDEHRFVKIESDYEPGKPMSFYEVTGKTYV